MAPFAKMENPGGIRMEEDDDFSFAHVELDCYSCGSVSEKPRRMLGVALGSFSSIRLGLTFYLLQFAEHPVTSVTVDHAGAPQISGVSRWLSSLYLSIHMLSPSKCVSLQSVFLLPFFCILNGF